MGAPSLKMPPGWILGEAVNWVPFGTDAKAPGDVFLILSNEGLYCGSFSKFSISYENR
jgi:hypothetical protein